MFSKKMYVVATTSCLGDVNVVNIYDGDVFSLSSLVEGLKKQLRGKKTQVSVLEDWAFIDILDDHDELQQTYSIISKITYIKKA